MKFSIADIASTVQNVYGKVLNGARKLKESPIGKLGLEVTRKAYDTLAPSNKKAVDNLLSKVSHLGDVFDLQSVKDNHRIDAVEVEVNHDESTIEALATELKKVVKEEHKIENIEKHLALSQAIAGDIQTKMTAQLNFVELDLEEVAEGTDMELKNVQDELEKIVGGLDIVEQAEKLSEKIRAGKEITDGVSGILGSVPYIGKFIGFCKSVLGVGAGAVDLATNFMKGYKKADVVEPVIIAKAHKKIIEHENAELLLRETTAENAATENTLVQLIGNEIREVAIEHHTTMKWSDAISSATVPEYRAMQVASYKGHMVTYQCELMPEMPMIVYYPRTGGDVISKSLVVVIFHKMIHDLVIHSLPIELWTTTADMESAVRHCYDQSARGMQLYAVTAPESHPLHMPDHTFDVEKLKLAITSPSSMLRPVVTLNGNLDTQAFLTLCGEAQRYSDLYALGHNDFPRAQWIQIVTLVFLEGTNASFLTPLDTPHSVNDTIELRTH